MGSGTGAMEPPAVSTDGAPHPISQSLERLRSMPPSASMFHETADLLSGLQQDDWAAFIHANMPPASSAPHASVPASLNRAKSKEEQLPRRAAMANRRERAYNGSRKARRKSASRPQNTHEPATPSLPASKRQRRSVQQFDDDLDFEGMLNPGMWRRNSVDTTSSQCCSSCSEGVPCAEPDCGFQKEAVVACIQPECSRPLCPDECLSGALGGGTGLYQENIPSSARLSDWNYSAWNPQLQRSSPQITRNLFKDVSSIIPTEQAEELQSPSGPGSALPTPPSLVHNLGTPFSPSATLATPQSTNSSHAEQSNASGPILSGTGMMFDALATEWNQQAFSNANLGNGSPMFNCAWSGCAQPFASQQEWTEHIHHAHVDPQMTFYCPLPTENCQQNISHHPLHHLEADHGYSFLMNNQYSCPAPNCDSDETFLNPKMLHNHFDQAHAMPASGSLFCQWNSCDTAFSNPHELFTHLNEHHQLSTLLGTEANSESPNADTKYPLSITDAELSEDDTRNRCKWKTGHRSVCGTVCETESDLQTHVKEAHLKSLNNRVGYNCQWQGCSRPGKLGNKSGFTARGKLERHMASHTGCRRYPWSPEIIWIMLTILR
jgi:hypothetical protein